MSHINYELEENAAAPLVNVFQLITLPILSFGVITPLWLGAGHGVFWSFLIGWATSLGAMVTLILVSFLAHKFRATTMTSASTTQACTNPHEISNWLHDLEKERKNTMFAAWDLDAVADRLDATQKRLTNERCA